MVAKKLSKGSFLGRSVTRLHSFGSILGMSDYDSTTFSNWHDHENSYFAFIIKGGNTEIRQNSELECSPGTLLFCKSGEIHKNINYLYRTRILHVEFEKDWFNRYDVKDNISNQYHIKNPLIKNIFLTLANELINSDIHSRFIAEGMLLQAYSLMQRGNEKNYKAHPNWVSTLQMFLDENNTEPSLLYAAGLLNIHPVTLSKDFMKYFGCNFSAFMQKRKLQKSIAVLSKNSISVETIAFQSGFADASHYIKVFKKYYGITPAEYRRRLS